MPDHKPIQLTAADVMAISDALVAADQALARYHGRKIQLDAEPFKADFARDFKRLLRAKRVLSRELTYAEREEIVGALTYSQIAVALHEGGRLTDGAPSSEMGFGSTGDTLQAAIKLLDVTPQQ